MSGSKSRVGTHWRKPATHVYDYNYNLGEHYYKPQLNHMELKHHGRAGSPPKAKTFAERFAEDPVHGYGPRTWRPASTLTGYGAQPRKTSLTDDFSFRPGPTSADLFSPTLDDRGRPRFSLGDRLLDSVGVGPAGSPSQTNFGRGGSPSRTRANQDANLASDIQDDPFGDPFFQRSKKLLKRIEGPRSAEADVSEDPFKSRSFRRMDSSDDILDDMKLDSDEQISKFRSKLRAKRAQDELESAGADDFGLSESRADRIRSRVKARLAELEDDFPAMSIKSGRGNNESLGSRSMNDMESSSGASKSVRISKRSIRTTVEN
jgi:hypothetical protein